MRCFFVIFVLGAATTAATPAHSEVSVETSSLTQGPACALIEGLPGLNAPLRKARALKAILKAIENPTTPPDQMKRRYVQLEKLIHDALTQATTVFHDKPRSEWTAREQNKARRYLEKHVLGKHPLLQIGAVGFEPRPGLRAALMYAACRAGRHEDAIRWGRRASRREEAPARAFAALLLLEGGRKSEARELLDVIRGPSFLTAWIRAELNTDPDVRRRHRAAARRRVTTSAQQDAVAAQARRAQPQ
jgi:hypothetical protein